MKNIKYILFAILFSGIPLFAQSARSSNNSGVDDYHKDKYSDAEANFKKSLEKDPKLFEGNYNLGDALYKQQRYDEAVKSYQKALEETNSLNNKAKVYHNIGNSFLEAKKYKESIEAYKNSLRLNPDDNETKYNLSYALAMLKNQQNKNKQDNQNKKDNDKNKDKNKNNKNQNQNDKKDQNKNKQQNPSKPDQNQTAKNDQLKQNNNKNKMSKEEAERILQALRNNELDLQKKLRQKNPQKNQPSKDW